MAWLAGLLFVLGLVLLVGGAEALVRGASAIAQRMGMSRLLIGITIVAVGTSAPELVVSVVASMEGQGDIALGNAVGSNILNILVVLGLAAVVAPVMVHQDAVRRDLPLVLAASVGVFLLALNGRIGRVEGVVLLACLVLYLAHAYRSGREVGDAPPAHAPRRRAAGPFVLAIVGGGLLVLGGHFVIEGGVAIAARLGVPERVVALTLIALGTSLPELATTLVAARRREMDLAVGNIMGSNLFNLFLVLGLAAVVRPVPVVPAALWIDLPVMAGAALLLLPLVRSGFRLVRWEGLLLLGAYAAYAALIAGRLVAG